ncbi:hypothetical protein VCSRO99_0408 [Vibrio cholerae]|nr:hypothetical protein VCSRO99_0408 [Vibrio cholerae]
MNETLLALVAFSPIIGGLFTHSGGRYFTGRPQLASQESHARGFRPDRCDCPDILGYVG